MLCVSFKENGKVIKKDYFLKVSLIVFTFFHSSFPVKHKVGVIGIKLKSIG